MTDTGFTEASEEQHSVFVMVELKPFAGCEDDAIDFVEEQLRAQPGNYVTTSFGVEAHIVDSPFRLSDDARRIVVDALDDGSLDPNDELSMVEKDQVRRLGMVPATG